jgi:hypothetical protein
MATTTFDALILAAQSDLEAELPGLELIAQADSGEQQRRITKSGDRIKSELKRELQQVLPSIFVNSMLVPNVDDINSTYSDWLVGQNLKWNQIDTILDKIANPEVMLDCYVAGWKWKLYTVQWEELLSADKDVRQAYESARDYWDEQFHDIYSKSWVQLRFDLNNDGVSDPSERTITRNTIRRV